MNLNFVNINTSLNEILSPSVQVKNGLKGSETGNGFAQSLMALLSPGKGEISTRVDAKAITTDLEALLGQNVSDPTAPGFIAQLKRYLEMAGVVLENATLDKKGLAALEELLLDQGFKPGEVNALMVELKTDEEGGVSLFELMENLEALGASADERADKEDILLPISDFPFILSLLTALHIPEDFSKNLLSEAKEEGKGISLDRLIKGLQGLQKQSFFSGVDFKADPGNNGFDQILKSLGIQNQGTTSHALTLGDFVTALENMRAPSDPGTSLPTVLTKDPGLMAGLNFSNGEKMPGLSDLLSRFRSSDHLNSPDFSRRSDQSTMDQMADGSGVGKKSEVESLLNTIFKGITQNGEQSVEKNNFFNQGELPLEKMNQDTPVNFPGVKVASNPQTLDFPGFQGSVDPEVIRGLQNVEAVVKEMKNNADGARAIEQAEKSSPMAKESRTTISTVDASGGGNGFREMGMGNRSQAPTTAPSARTVLPSYVTNQVGKSLARAVSQGDTELKLQLRPPELGRIIMTIDNHGTSLKVSVVTENQAAREILASHANELKTVLAANGISINSFDVEMGSDFQQSMADARHNPKGSGSKHGRTRGTGTGSLEGTSDPIMDVRGFSGDDLSLHFVA